MSDTDKQADLGGVRARDVALTALRGAIEEIAEIQQRVALRRLLEAQFGHRALPIREFFRRLPNVGWCLREAPRYVGLEDKADADRLAVLYPMVEALEAMFRDQQAQRDADFFAAMAAHFGRAAK